MSEPEPNRDQRYYDPDLKLRVVHAAVERKLTNDEVRQLFGVRASTWRAWLKIFRESGEDGLRRTTRSRKPAAPTTDTPAKFDEHVIEAKRNHPFFGVVRLWHWLRRTLFLPITRREVRDTLARVGLLQPPPPGKRQPPQPRRF